MKILRPEEVNAQNIGSLIYRELTPEELKEAYALADAAFTAADLQRFTELNDDGVDADEFLREMEEIVKQNDANKKSALTMEGNGQTYKVEFVGLSKAELRRHALEATAAGTGEQLLTALQQIVARLKKAPLNFGEPSYRLPSLKLQIRRGVIAPLLVYYGVHEEKPLVMISGTKLLS